MSVLPAGYLELCGTVICNSQQTLEYAKHLLGLNSMAQVASPVLPIWLGDPQPYTTPAGDGSTVAPWYDPSNPDSAEFCGLFITDITGLDTSTVSRSTANALSDGSVLGRLRRNSRTIHVTGVLFGTWCGVRYGTQWLSAALASTCDPCGQCDLCYLNCNPMPFANCAETGALPTTGDFDREQRTLHRVGLVDGVNVLQDQSKRSGDCFARTIDFTLLAGDPYAYKGPAVVTPSTLLLPGMSSGCVQWVDCSVPGSTTDCLPTATLLLDPMQPKPVAPPSPPTISSSTLCTPLTSAQSCFEIPASGEGFFDRVPIVSVHSGSQPLRNLILNFYDDPLGLMAASDCAQCSGIGISYMPAGATLTLDAERREITLVGAGTSMPIDASSVVYSDNGEPFTWPQIGCVSVTVCVKADESNTATDASIKIETVERVP